MPAKRDTYRQEIRPLLAAALVSPGLLSPADFNRARYHLDPAQRAPLADPDIAALDDFLIDHSHLPGPRADLELIAALADEVAALCAAPDVPLNHSYVALEWLLWQMMHRYPPDLYGSDPDSPLQMPQIAGAVALGEWAAAFSQIEHGAAALLEQSNSPLWRLREAAAMGLQRLLARAWESTLRRLQRRALDATPYEWRALVAAVAEPPILTSTARALDAQDVHYGALAALRALPPSARRADDVRTLRQALAYSVSVVVAAAPESGFALMNAWAAWDDPDVTWLLRENLKKNRLSRWPEQVDALRARLAAQS